ncbi:MAG: MFS transporter [Candidatus Thorarchaeota archaeon]
MDLQIKINSKEKTPFENLDTKVNNYDELHLSKRLVRNIVSLGCFIFSYNFVTTLEYVYFREMLLPFGIFDSVKNSSILTSALIFLCVGVVFGGILNDKTRTKLGQRVPFILIGGLIASFCILLIPILFLIEGNLSLVYGILMLLFIISHFSLGLAYSPWLALVVDLFKKKERVICAIAISIFGAIGAAVATIVFSFLIIRNHYWLIWVITGITLLLGTIITSILCPKTNSDIIVHTNIKETMNIPKIIWKQGGIEWTLLLIVAMFWSFSSHLVETGIVDSLIKRFNVQETQAAFSSNILMGIFISVFIFPIIFMINKMGKIKGSILASVVYAGYCFFLSTMTNFNEIYYIVCIGGLGNILLSTLQIALPADNVPKGREASFMGFFFVFSTIVKPFATLIQGFLIRNNEASVGISEFFGYPGTFFLAGIVCLFSLGILFTIESQNKQIEELYE